MRTTFAFLTVAVLLSACTLLLEASSIRADHTGGPMQAMSIDMNEDATPANTSSAVGTREICTRIDENDTLDADEDVIDGVKLDVNASNIPAFHNSGTPLDASDDTGGIVVYTYEFNYSSANLTVNAEEFMNPAVNILFRNGGSSIFSGTDLTPDDNGDDVWYSAKSDTSPSTPEDGSGVLDRLTLVSETGATAGIYPLTLSNTAHADASGAAYVPSHTENAFVAIDTVCDVDGDSVPDAQDACPTLAGLASKAGCPPPGPPAVGGTAGLVESGEESIVDSARRDDAGVPASCIALFGGMILASAAGLGWRLRRYRSRT